MNTHIVLHIVKHGRKDEPLRPEEVAAFGADMKEFLRHPRIRQGGFELLFQVKSAGKPTSEEVLYQNPAESNDATTAINTVCALFTHNAFGKNVKISLQGMSHEKTLEWLGLASPEKEPTGPDMAM